MKNLASEKTVQDEAMQKGKEIMVPTAPPTKEPNKGRQPLALEISSLSAYFGASRNLYAQRRLQEHGRTEDEEKQNVTVGGEGREEPTPCLTLESRIGSTDH
ncbi:hypothetical protein AVEN_8248-1 [Araneus ventricosus]|uniref:Uncharacterized protein n=1 Tax=Araneus ventricosus TaxID=182803 RepID=A0A4Y2L0I0_ARAVE|nr:hypothetical protein AVEN_8248-1 [Araneus ventricosus]